LFIFNWTKYKSQFLLVKSKIIMSNVYSFEEFLFTSTKTTIQKAKRIKDNLEVVFKKPSETFPSVTVLETFRKDFQFASMLHQSFPESFVNMIELIEHQNGSVSLIEEYEGVGLQIYLKEKKSLTLQEFLNISQKMTTAVHYAHSKQVFHRDIKVGNFTFNETTGNVKLIDFGLSTIVSRKSPSVACTHPIGTFSYMPPEQTGRISKNADFRSDIYSLGISFYELLTGELPFVGDKLAVVHSQITKKLPNVQNIPNVLDELIQKMCSKNPSERYSSALGVLKDLEFIASNLENIPKDFQVGKMDLKEFQIPNKLYGREKEIKMLKNAISSLDHSNMCLVSGPSGMGKSKLVEELLKDQELNLLMAYGKFDQFNRLTPYSAFVK
jgi:serine/threonine protein kinase